ncbi:MAG: Uma2 family endonuclease [Segetibacter sp.]|nr:Uma2 family endonuclease [Segetibacter sp.]
MKAIEQVPKTALDVFRLLPEGTLCEVIDNVLYMSPALKYHHQDLLFLLARRIEANLEITSRGKVIISPFDVYFDDLLSAVQPHILVLLNENKHLLKADGYIHGAPDLIIEVLSSDKKRDKVKKKSLYERAGVKEYFVVDPDTREITGWVLKGNLYEQQNTDTGVFKSLLLSLEFTF